MNCGKELLGQYSSIKREIADIEFKIGESEKKIRLLEKQIARDAVVGSREDLTIGIIPVEGIASQRIDEIRERIHNRRERLLKMKAKLERIRYDIETFIDSIEDSETRRIIQFRFVDDLSWDQVAKRMGPGYESDACRKKFKRFMKE